MMFALRFGSLHLCLKGCESLCVSAVRAVRLVQPCSIPTSAQVPSSTMSVWVAVVMRIPYWSAGAGSFSPMTATMATKQEWFVLNLKVRQGCHLILCKEIHQK